jgi:hypothetical protein
MFDIVGDENDELVTVSNDALGQGQTQVRPNDGWFRTVGRQ